MLLDNLSDLFQRGLEYGWDCEHLLLKHLPKMSEAASSPELRQALDLHLGQTQTHVARLEQIFARLDRAPAAEKNEPMHVLVEESHRIMSHLERSPLMDAALIFSGNQIEHYEIGLYGSLVSFALTLGLEDVAGLLDEILAEEKAADQKLTQLAQTSVNRAASNIHNAPPFALI